MKQQITSAAAVLLLGASALSAQLSINMLNTTYSQSFSGFNGTAGTLPLGWSWQGGGTDIFRGQFHSGTNAAGDFTGVMAATNGTSPNSIVWRESTGAANLGDFRLIFAVTNNTGAPITSFAFSYTLETWVNGRRDNEMRFKYDVSLDADAAGRSLFETDILARDGAFTRNPNHTEIASNGAQFNLDGSQAANRTLVSGTIDLNTLLINETDASLGAFGALGVGETAYFRWQISNNLLTAGNRSALGIHDFTVTAIPEPSTYAAILGLLALGLVWLRRRSAR